MLYSQHFTFHWKLLVLRLFLIRGETLPNTVICMQLLQHLPTDRPTPPAPCPLPPPKNIYLSISEMTTVFLNLFTCLFILLFWLFILLIFILIFFMYKNCYNFSYGRFRNVPCSEFYRQPKGVVATACT